MSWVIWNSHSKSEIARRPFTITCAPSPARTRRRARRRRRPRRSRARRRVLQQPYALLQGEHRLLVARLRDDSDDHVVEHTRRSFDHVDVAVGDGVVRSGIDRVHHQRSKRLSIAAPERRDVRNVSGSSGSRARDDVSRTSTPSSATRRGRWRGELRLELGPRLVRRVDEDEVVRARLLREASRPRRRRRHALPSASASRGSAEIVRQAACVALDERRARRAARERLDPHRARAGEEVEHDGVVDRTDQVERGLADAVAGRAGRAALSARRSARRGGCRR